eukprot:NODE_14925_length_1077_cov_5.374737.p1 GENE.NODE_14925_length_1077_cov_5.374737~~NODE_14925_length_1077_cov_5.374737.p1  ORF type:complete len:171 (+),score=56.46 NODE_14925_length_1077_cov_5.374737:315-827(+)
MLESASATDAGFVELSLPDEAALAQLSFADVPVVDGETLRVVRRMDALESPGIVDIASGVKLWECSIDLARHLYGLGNAEALDGTLVLELGAGHGLPGIAALRRGARVDFHDMSAAVLREVTAANVAAATGSAPSRFIAGSWKQLRAAAGAHGLRYDMILAAEVIYKQEA